MCYWTSRGLSEEHAYEAWRAQLSNLSVPWQLNAKTENPFFVNYHAEQFGKLAITHCRFSACRGYRGRADIHHSADVLYCVQFMMRGRENVAYDDNQDTLLAGDAYIWDSEKEFTFCTMGKVESFSLGIPKDLFLSMSEPGAKIIRKIDFKNGMGAVLFQAVLSAFNSGPAFSHVDRGVVERAIVQLTASAFCT